MGLNRVDLRKHDEDGPDFDDEIDDDDTFEIFANMPDNLAPVSDYSEPERSPIPDSPDSPDRLESPLEVSSENSSDDEYIPESNSSDDILDKNSDDEDVESDTSSIKSLEAGRDNTDEDDLIKIIKRSKNVKRQQPPDIMNDDVVTNISFSSSDDIIAVGTIEGDICLYSYDVEKTELILKYSAHMGSCRTIEYDENGKLLYTASEDKSIIVAESNSGKFRNVYDNAHESGIFSLSVINENLFCTGDDSGIVKLWDRRKKEEAFSVKIGDDYVSSLRSIGENSTLACTAGNGIVTSVNMNTRRLISQSEQYHAEITCSGLFCSDTKLAVGTSVGSILLYSWGQFTSWNDEFPGLDKQKYTINCMIPITENIAITGLENGLIRATHLFPMRNIGIVGQHSSTVECLDINRDGTLLASCSIENKVCFWNVEYFEDVHFTDKNKKDNDKAREHNLPSSFGVNTSDFFAGLAS